MYSLYLKAKRIEKMCVTMDTRIIYRVHTYSGIFVRTTFILKEMFSDNVLPVTCLKIS
jgi:hypothetical protein